MSGNQGLFSIKNEIGIINLALSQLSIDPIPSFEENTKIADQMKRNFQLAKENILRTYVFDWAHKAEKLVKYADEAGGYQKPADYINFIGLGTSENFCCCDSSWKNLSSYTHDLSVREVNGRLYINSCCASKYDWLHYSYNNQHYTTMPSDLLQAIAFELAYTSCMSLTKSESLTNFMRQRRDEILSSARQHSGFENKQTNHDIFGKPYGWVEGVPYALSPSTGGFR